MTPHGLPSDQYHCLLDEQPYYLTPPYLLGRTESPGPLIVNPACWFSWHGALPADKATRLRFTECLLPSERMVWVEDPATLAIWPYWLGEEYFEFVSRMQPGRALEEELPLHIRWVLTEARVLVEPNYLAKRRCEWRHESLEYANAFRGGYVNVPGLIQPFHVGALRRYYRCRTRSGRYVLGDEQVRRRFAAHNEPVCRFLQHQLSHAVSDIAGIVVKPSYAYFIAYLGGAKLERHVDREQCDYSVTTCVDASPEPHGESQWPIHLQTATEESSIWQFLGDALLYRGCSVAHSREELADGLTSTSLLLHYVSESFEGGLD